MDETIQVLILDNEKVFARKTKTLVEAFFQMQDVNTSIHACTDKESLLKKLKTCNPDLLITEIELKSDKCNGIDIAAEIKQRVPTCQIVYLTADLSYATEIYETEPLYFLLKEQMEEKLAKALHLYITKQKKTQQYIRVFLNRALLTIKIDKIMYCEHVGKYTKIVCAGGETYPIRISMKKLMTMLEASGFAYTHSGFIVNLAYVKCYTRSTVTLATNDTIPIGRSHLDNFKCTYAAYLSKNAIYLDSFIENKKLFKNADYDNKNMNPANRSIINCIEFKSTSNRSLLPPSGITFKGEKPYESENR